MPDRIDHHGWQLALLSLAIAGLADPKRARGGATLGLATALSLAIGLELLIYLALAGAATVLFWIDDAGQRRRLLAYAATLGRRGRAVVPAVRFLRQPRGGVRRLVAGVAVRCAARRRAARWRSPGCRPRDWKRRLALAAAAGAVVAAFHALSWPQCLQRLEGVSPEVHDLWLSHVREARPVYRHGWQVASMILALPVTGAIGWALLTWRNRVDRDLLPPDARRRGPGAGGAGADVLADPDRPGRADAERDRRGGDRLARRARFLAHQEFPAAAVRPCRGGDHRHRRADAAGGEFHPAQAGDPARHRHLARQPARATSSARSGRSPSSPRAGCSPSSTPRRG